MRSSRLSFHDIYDHIRIIWLCSCFESILIKGYQLIQISICYIPIAIQKCQTMVSKPKASLVVQARGASAVIGAVVHGILSDGGSTVFADGLNTWGDGKYIYLKKKKNDERSCHIVRSCWKASMILFVCVSRIQYIICTVDILDVNSLQYIICTVDIVDVNSLYIFSGFRKYQNIIESQWYTFALYLKNPPIAECQIWFKCLDMNFVASQPT